MMAVKCVGAERLLLGTDDPYVASDTRHVEALDLTDAEKAGILGGNAARLLGI